MTLDDLTVVCFKLHRIEEAQEEHCHPGRLPDCHGAHLNDLQFAGTG